MSVGCIKNADIHSHEFVVGSLKGIGCLIVLSKMKFQSFIHTFAVQNLHYFFLWNTKDKRGVKLIFMFWVNYSQSHCYFRYMQISVLVWRQLFRNTTI